MDSRVVEHLDKDEELAFRKCMKEELQKHSYLTMSKNVSTAEQIIKAVELNGGRVNSSAYTSKPEEDRERHDRLALILMFIARSFDLPKWYEITGDNYTEWLDKILKLTPGQEEVYKIFTQQDLNEKLEMYQNLQKQYFKNSLEKQLAWDKFTRKANDIGERQMTFKKINSAGNSDYPTTVHSDRNDSLLKKSPEKTLQIEDLISVRKDLMFGG